MHNNTKQKSVAGFTLIEIVVFIGLAVGIMFVVGGFVNNIASLRDYFGDTLSAEEDVQFALTEMIPELRAMAQSNVGNYPIEAANQSSITFFSDIDHDGIFDRVRYFLSGTTLRKGVIVPTGNPLQYILTNEVVKNVLEDIATTTIFSYFDETYTGAESPLLSPVNVSDIRMVKAVLIVDENPNALPGPFMLSRQVTLRNLRNDL